MNEPNRKEYLGDSVYADIENGAIKLYLDNGYGEHNIIVLELEVYENLVKYVDRQR